MASNLHRQEKGQLGSSSPREERFNAKGLFGLRLWLKLEVAMPFVLIEAASAITDFHLAVIVALVLSFLGTMVEDFLFSRARLTRSKFFLLLAATAALPLTAYGALLFRLKALDHFGNPLAIYGLGRVICFLCAFILVGRIVTELIETWLDSASKRSKRGVPPVW
jgi:hypothetical protein